MLANKRVLITGAGGFIGSHLVELCVREGARVTGLVRYNSSSSTGHLAGLPADVRGNIQIVAGNIEDSDFVLRSSEGQEIILHLAALIAIPYSYVAPRSYVRTNIEGTLNVLEAARRYGLERVVHTSTSEVYGTARTVPISEEHPLQGQSPYSATKIGADKLAESYYRSFNTPVITLRPFNTYGPRQSLRAIIPTVIQQALEKDKIELGSLEPQRDMTFVADTCHGFLRAATASGIYGETINLGTGQTFTIGDLAYRILRIMGVDKPIVSMADRMRPPKSEVLKLVSDNSRARVLLGWSPQIPLDEGLKRTIDYIIANRHSYRSGTYVI
jgi:NAD dependent epimerase/dehydratase